MNPTRMIDTTMNERRRSPISPQSSGELQPVQWSPHQRGGRPKNGGSGRGAAAGPSRNAIKSIKLASTTASDFDKNYTLRDVERERSVPLFHGTEVILQSAEPFRMYGFYAEYGLNGVSLSVDQHDQQQQKFGPKAEETRQRYAERIQLNSEHFSAKYLQKGIVDTDRGMAAASEMILEAKVLMNLARHPNIMSIYGVNQNGIDSFLENGRKSFFLISDRIKETLVDRLNSWRENRSYVTGRRIYDDLAEDQSHFMERLEIANDICSALVFLHNRKLVINIRPDKVGFDTKCGRVKIFAFGQARQDGMEDHASSITKSDDVANTLAYTAPEVLCSAPATIATDVYGFGIMLWEILSLQRPFVGWYNRAQHYEKVVQNNQRPPITEENEKMWPKEVCQLIPKCWDPHMRLTMKAVGETLETALLFREGNPELVKAAATATTTCDTNNNNEKGMQTPKSKRRGVQRSQSHDVPLEVPTGSGTPTPRKQRTQSRGRRKSFDGAGAKEGPVRRGSRGGRETPTRRKICVSKSLDSLINSADDPAALLEALTKLAKADTDAKSNETLPIDVSNNSNTSSSPSPGTGPSKGKPVLRRRHSTSRLSTSPGASPTRQRSLTRRRSHSINKGGDSTPSTPRRSTVQGEEWATKTPSSTPATGSTVACTHLEKTRQARTDRVKRSKSDVGPKTASLISPGAAFCLDNLVAMPRRSSSISPSPQGPLFKDLSLPPAPSVDDDDDDDDNDHSSPISVILPSKGRRKTTSSASNKERANRTADSPHDVMARFSKSFSSLSSSDFQQEDKSGHHEDSDASRANRFYNSFSSLSVNDFDLKDTNTNPKVIRLKVKKGRSFSSGR